MIWLVGRDGMLGSEVANALEARGEPYIGTDREVDIADASAVEGFAAEHRPDWIVNCAAYTAVDRAEEERSLARAVNTEGPRNLARVSQAYGSRLLHISTDYVFDGSKEGCYEPEDPVSPLGAYGRTKAVGEAAIATETRRYLILRTAWLYGKHGKNFVSTILRLLRESGTVRVVRDQRGSPTYARDLATVMLHVIESMGQDDAYERYGIYHYTNKGHTTWFEFAEEIARQASTRGLLEGEARVEPILSAEYGAKAPRPANSRLSLEKFVRAFGLQPPSWQEALSRYLEEIAT